MNLHRQWMAFVIAATAIGAAHAGEISFNRDIRPILSENCYYCHGFDEDHRQADLRLDDRDAALAVIEEGNADDSELLRRILSDDSGEVMPPPDAHKPPLSAEQIELIRRWINEGADYESHWAFTPPKKPDDAPQFETLSKAIDHYVGKRLAKENLSFAPQAAPAKWLRRMAIDVTGLPPTLPQLDAFIRDAETRGEPAYQDAVDAALDTNAYGERMALEWLDVARYADTNGFQQDAFRMNWPWRDWVIDAFNQNMPYDQFVTEQLAGDLLGDTEHPPTQSQMVATAFNRNHMLNNEGGAIMEENLAKTYFDRVETTSTSMLGLTVGCCQCHDHKFDPLKQTDYYSLVALFNRLDEKAASSKGFSVKPEGKPFEESYAIDKPYIAVADDATLARVQTLGVATRGAYQALEQARPQFEPEFKKWVLEMRADPSLIDQRVPDEAVARNINTAPLDEYDTYVTQQLRNYFLDRDERFKPLRDAIKTAVANQDNAQGDVPLVMVMRDDKPRETFVMLRGNYETLGERVTASVPEFLPPLKVDEDREPNRLDFARWLVAEENPLFARVAVNRYWQLFFGRAIVATPDDFGLQGAWPTHPGLLDYLAVEFRESGWDVKSLVRSMVLSKTYRQSAVVDEDVRSADPNNDWFSRGSRQRIDSRLLRDQALSLAGLLHRQIGGRPVSPYQPGGIWEEMSLDRNHYMRDNGESLYRRSLYTVWRRVATPANFFDVASRQSCNVKTTRTSTPLHALTLLNDTTYVEAARSWADRLSIIGGDEARLRRAFFAATAREPADAELQQLVAAVDENRTHFEQHPEDAAALVDVGEANSQSGTPAAEHAAWTTVCLLILNLDETLCK